jgi:hypothetical protein
MTKPIAESRTFPLQGGIDLVREKGLLPMGSFTDIQNMRPRRPGKESRKGCMEHHTTTAHSTKELISLFHFSKGKLDETRLFAQYDTGLIDEGTDDPFDSRGAITAFADAGGGKVTVTSEAHGLSNADVAVIAETINYNGAFVVSGVTANTYEITVTWVSDDATGIWIDTPTVGNFGSSALAARSNAWPAAWSTIKDYCVMSDGAGQHQIHTGQDAKIYAFNVYKGTEAIPTIPEEGADYTQEVVDGQTTTYADLGDLDALADNHCLFVITDVPVDLLTLAFSAWNSTEVGALVVKYWDGSNLTAVSGLADGTQGDGSGGSGTIEFGKDGTLTWTSPSDEKPYYAFGRSGFIYQISHAHGSNTLDSSVQLTSLTCEYTGGFQDVQNVWDGILVPAIESRIYDATATTYSTYSSQSIKPGSMPTSGYIYFNSLDPLFGIYLEVGKTPNSTASTALDLVETWTGAAFATVGASLDDGTDGGSKTGFVTWNRSVVPKKVNFNSSRYHSYWYRISFNEALSASLTWAIQTLPYFDIDRISPTGQANATWKDRTCYSFEDNFVHFSAQNAPMVLNGDDYGLIGVGDGRSNPVRAMRKYYNELFVWQAEKGKEGGCLTIIEGDSPVNFEKLVLSTQIGIMNDKCVEVLEDVNISDLNVDRPVFKGIFWLSRYGFYKSEGRVLRNISGGISNYFDPTKPECIRAGYEDKHWLTWDSAYNILCAGIVSGSTATKPNVWFVYDPVLNTWMKDDRAQPISCMVEVGAASGNLPVLQYAGTQDGRILRVNITDNDLDIAIHKRIIMELNARGRQIILRQEIIRCKTQLAGDITRTIAKNGNSSFGVPKTYTMVEAASGDDYKRKRDNIHIEGDHLSIKWENNVKGQPMYILDIGLGINEVPNNA